MSVRDTLLSKRELGGAISSSSSVKEALEKVGVAYTKNAVEQLGIVCKIRGICLDNILKRVKHEKVLSTCPKCGVRFQNKASGKESKTFCGRKCANEVSARLRDQKSINEKIAVATAEAMKKTANSDVTITCANCSLQFTVKFFCRKRVFCSRTCMGQAWGKKHGREAGKKSANKMVKRSKNEVLFSELCSTVYDVLCNEPVFDGWDADVVIPKLKVAVLWNGVWHYKDNLRKGHSLEQVQTRDIIKIAKIKEAGYSAYTVKDMGSFNKDFVQSEFQKFLEHCEKLNTGT